MVHWELSGVKGCSGLLLPHSLMNQARLCASTPTSVTAISAGRLQQSSTNTGSHPCPLFHATEAFSLLPSSPYMSEKFPQKCTHTLFLIPLSDQSCWQWGINSMCAWPQLHIWSLSLHVTHVKRIQNCLSLHLLVSLCQLSRCDKRGM